MATTNDILLLKDLLEKALLRITDLEAENALLRTENAELRSRLNQNSENSHKPPSSDGLKKKPALNQSSGKKTGGQLGHKGRTLKMVERPDLTLIHHAAICPYCNKVFTVTDIDHIEQKRQIFDIPDPRMEVTEHQIGVIMCCGQAYVGHFPDGVNQPVQYGTKIKALSTLLNTDYKIPVEKIEQLLGDLYACSFNESTVLSTNDTYFEALEPIEQSIKKEILAAPVAHFDETGMRVTGQLHWFHVASTSLFTYLFVHPHRGKQALSSTWSLLKDFKNWAVHDCWQSYFDFDNCRHALCNAHILRELEALKQIGTAWASDMHNLLMEIYHLSEKATLILPDKELWTQKYTTICHNADKEEPPPSQGKRGKPKNSKGRNLLNRLVLHQDGILAFAFHPHVPFTNNQAERDIRCLKTKQKVANSFRTLKGAKNYARIQSFISTLRKHDMNVFDNLINILNNKQVVFQYA